MSSLPPGFPDAPWRQLLRWMRTPIEYLTAAREQFGETFTVRLPGIPPIIVASNPADVKAIFAGNGEEMMAGVANRVLEPFLGKFSLLTLDGPQHARHRKLLMPPLHGERLESYGADMLSVTDAAIDRFPVADAFAMHKQTQSITLDIILRTVFGMRDDAEREPFKRSITQLLELGAWPPLLLPQMQVDLGPLSPWGRFQRALREGDTLLYRTIRTRRAQGDTARGDILSLLLATRDEDGEPMSDVELRDELVTLCVAGHETTATALSWAMRWILRDAPLYRRLRDEVRALAARGPLVPAQVQKLELLDATVKETLRLVPVVMMVGREVQHPIRIGGYDLPAKTFVAPNILLGQRRSEAFPDPMKFDPNRFVGARTSPAEWFPFGGGLRRCIGAAFAQYEMKMVLAAMLARTTMRLASQAPIVPVRRSITLAPSGGVRVIVDVKEPAISAHPPARKETVAESSSVS